jgi:hypothetical protein
VVVLVVVRGVCCTAEVVDVYFYVVVCFLLKPPFIAPVGAIGRVHAQIWEGDPV